MEIDEKVIEVAIGRRNATATYTCIYKDGKVRNNNSGSCHADLLHGRLGKPELIVNKRCYKERRNEGTTLFYDWLLNRSPWADAFVTKDAEVADKSHTILTAHVPRDMLGTALVATRGPWEKSSRFVLYKELVDLGMPEHLAYAAITFYELNSKGGISERRIDSNHWPFLGSHESVLKFLRVEDWPEYSGTTYNQSPGWGEASQHFLGGQHTVLDIGGSKFRELYDKALHEVGAAKVKSSLNIFPNKGEEEKRNHKASALDLKYFIEQNWNVS